MQSSFFPDFSFEDQHQNKIVVGIDEVGRGPLAGPVVSACVLLDRNFLWNDVNDSKRLSKKVRKKIYLELKSSNYFGIGIVDEKAIDKINILEAAKLSMLYAYQDFCQKISIVPDVVLVDGNFAPFKPQKKSQLILPIIKGDQKSKTIAAASIFAKEERDDIMLEFDKKYPEYGFANHFGYPTKRHLECLKKFGVCNCHRLSFKPVKNLCQS